MAKKRKKGKEKEEEEYEFIPPEFDEKEFIKKELRDSKAVIITVIYAILLGAVAGAISILSPSLVGLALVVVIAGIFTLKLLYELLNIDTSGFQKRNWAGNIATFFFTFLAIWILLLNTPFADFTKPVVNDVIVWVEDGGSLGGLVYTFTKDNNTYWWKQVNESSPAIIRTESNQTINITARVADNGKLRTVEIALGTPSNFTAMDKSSLANRFEHSIGVDELTPTFFVSAKDAKGHSTVFQPQKDLPIG